MLCVPGLQRSCPSLTPILGRLWRTAVSGLHTLPPPALAQWLPSTLGSGGKAGAGAALLGNLLEAAPSGLTPDPRHGEAALQRHSMHFMHVSASLLNLVPPGALFGPGTQWQAEDGADENGALEAEGASTATEQLPWDGTAPPMEVSDQLRLLADPGFIEAVTRAALPVASASPSQPVPDLTTAAAAAARQTCTYLSTILRLPGERQRILLALAFRAGLVQRLWFCFLRPAFEARGTGLWEQFGDDSCDPGWLLPLCLFSEVFSTSLMVSGDKGLYTRQEPLPLEELYSPERPVGVLSTLRSTLWNVLWLEAVPSTGWPRRAVSLRTRFARSAGRLMGQLHDRNGRRPFAPPEVFYAEGIVPERFRSEVASGVATGRGAEESDGSRAWAVLSSAPYLVPFLERARIFQRLVSAERSQYHDGSSLASALFDNGATRQFVAVQRGRVLDDAFAALGNSPSEDLRGRVRVAFTNEFGAAEAGIDGGGLFKEFLEAVVKEGFDPGRGLFRATTDNRLYPNPHAVRAVPDALRLLEFLGRMVGKALWEGILLELPLASFFLKKFRGAAADVDDLPTLDPVLARSLMSLEDYPGDVADLGLTFSLTDDVLGKPEEVDLVPGGRNLPVTSANARLFIHRVAEFKLNVQLREPVAAFLKGFRAMVPGTWVEMFNDMELQELIGGAEGGAALDLRDMQAHVAYSAGYSAEHPVIVAFWEALSGMTPQEQADFLRFVTSCPRPPLLGFGYLEPPLCIQMAGPGEEGGGGTERLPTAATCMNLLKLPPYRGGTAQVREKLLYAIQAGAGFDLS